MCQTSYIIRQTPHVTRHMSHVTSHVTRHMMHIIRYALYIMHHALQIMRYSIFMFCYILSIIPYAYVSGFYIYICIYIYIYIYTSIVQNYDRVVGCQSFDILATSKVISGQSTDIVTCAVKATLQCCTTGKSGWPHHDPISHSVMLS